MERNIKDSYKLSLLFGIYVLINMLLIFLGYWTVIVGLILLIGFIILQSILFFEQKKSSDEFPEF